jgi:hypothetical protein
MGQHQASSHARPGWEKECMRSQSRSMCHGLCHLWTTRQRKIAFMAQSITHLVLGRGNWTPTPRAANWFTILDHFMNDGCMEKIPRPRLLVLWIKVYLCWRKASVFSSERNAFGAHRSTGRGGGAIWYTLEWIWSAGAPPCTVRGLSRARARSPQDCVYGTTSCA